MFSSTLKRSVATLGVVAGLLAAAGPASAQIGVATTGTLHSGPGPVSNEALRLDVASSEVFKLNTFGGNDTLTGSLENTMISGYIDGNNLDRVFQIRGDAQDTQTSRASSLQNATDASK